MWEEMVNGVERQTKLLCWFWDLYFIKSASLSLNCQHEWETIAAHITQHPNRQNAFSRDDDNDNDDEGI